MARVGGEQGGSNPKLAPGDSRPCGIRSVGATKGGRRREYTGTGDPGGDSL